MLRPANGACTWKARMLAAPSSASEKPAYTGERATLARRRISRLLRW